MNSFIQTCKGRLSFLKQSLPKIMEFKAPEDEVIVVDYDCPDDCGTWARAQGAKIVKVNNAPIFNVCHARNLGAGRAQPLTDILIFVHADHVIQDGWIEAVTAPILSGEYGLVHNAPGACSIGPALFDQVNGYDESYEGWGEEDFDFWKRCEIIKASTGYPRELLIDLPHSDELRTQFYVNKNHKSNSMQSRSHRRNKHENNRPVNPNGRGRSEHRPDPQGKFKID